jgi:hypothetical protein
MKRTIICLLLTLCALTMTPAAGGSEPGTTLHAGDPFPQFSGQTITGKTLELPSVTASKPAIVLFSFSHAAGKDSQLWSQHLLKDFPDVPINSIILLESAPKFVRGMALSGIKGGMSPALQYRAVVLYQDEALWKVRLSVTDEHRVYLILLGTDGRVRWKNNTPFTDGAYIQLQKMVSMLEQDQSH